MVRSSGEVPTLEASPSARLLRLLLLLLSSSSRFFLVFSPLPFIVSLLALAVPSFSLVSVAREQTSDEEERRNDTHPRCVAPPPSLGTRPRVSFPVVPLSLSCFFPSSSDSLVRSSLAHSRARHRIIIHRHAARHESTLGGFAMSSFNSSQGTCNPL